MLEKYFQMKKLIKFLLNKEVINFFEKKAI